MFPYFLEHSKKNDSLIGYILLGVFRALETLHQQYQMPHSSVKTSNILFKQGQIRVIDFSINASKIAFIEDKIKKLKALESCGLKNIKEELLADKGDASKEIDLADLGKIGYELITGEKFTPSEAQTN